MKTILGAAVSAGLLAVVVCGCSAGIDGSPSEAAKTVVPTEHPDESTSAEGAATCSVPAHYALALSKSFAAPAPRPIGIAFDGKELWILNGGVYESGERPTTTLVRMNPDTLAVDATISLDLPNAQSPDAVIGGLAWDGEALWVADSDGADAAVLRINPASGSITDRVWTPPGPGPLSVYHHGKHLWLSTGGGDAYQMNPSTSAISQHFQVGDGSPHDQAIAVRDCEVWVGQLESGGVQIFDPNNGDHIATAVDEDGKPFSSIGPSVFVGTQLVVAKQLGIAYYDVVPKP